MEIWSSSFIIFVNLFLIYKLAILLIINLHSDLTNSFYFKSLILIMLN